MSEIIPASFADLKKAWDFYSKDQDTQALLPTNSRQYRLEFLQGIRNIQAKAWDAGWNAGHFDYVSQQDGLPLTKNPYRKDESDADD